jgi:hypothetical protein
VSPDVKLRVKSYSMPSGRKAGRKVADVSELVSVLRNEAKVI